MQEANLSSKENDCHLAYDEFISFYRKMAVRKELATLMFRLAQNEKEISLSQLKRFLQEEQGMVSSRVCLFALMVRDDDWL